MGGLSEAEIERMVKDAEAHAAEAKKRKVEVEAKNRRRAGAYTRERVGEDGLRVGDQPHVLKEMKYANGYRHRTCSRFVRLAFIRKRRERVCQVPGRS